ncbi:MAG: DUF815 domain-containing protein [Mogibacterium sp.]|nr:DUF815 domain-containing protein [Mogibacterium sp.]
MNDALTTLYYKLRTLSVFQTKLYEEPLYSVMEFLSAASSGDPAAALTQYSALARTLYQSGGDLGLAMRALALNGSEDVYLDEVVSGDEPSEQTKAALDRDLRILNEVASLTPAVLQSWIPADDFCDFGSLDLPVWENTLVDLAKDYADMIGTVGTRGYGIFRDYIMFQVIDGEVVPVADPSYKPLERFYGYRRERAEVLRNTEVLANGGNASNVLLYGDAGTGKSSTVKASAAAFADRGLRLIEFNKSQAADIPGIAASLKRSPLKFIFYIDDLSFTDSDDNFYCIKGILEGNVTGQPSNIVIYATSNRRHLVRESMEDRQGDDIHLNDTLQEIMSVSARFGLLITFQKPAKDLYLEIVKEMAEEYGVTYDDEADFFRRAETFAIRANGRSPRTAKQFVTLASEGMR